jgi:hypothetical protein
MRNRRLILFISLLSAIAVTCFSTTQSYYQKPVKSAENQHLVLRAQVYPNTELETVSPAPVQAWKRTVCKKTPPPELSTSVSFSAIAATTGNTGLNTSLLPVKDYLFHIYPSHNF